MANKKYKLTDGNYWATDGVYDFDQTKTQREINGELSDAVSDLNGAVSELNGAINYKTDFLDLGEYSASTYVTKEAAFAAAFNNITVTDKPVAVTFMYSGRWTGIACKITGGQYGTMYLTIHSIGETYFCYKRESVFTVYKNATTESVESAITTLNTKQIYTANWYAESSSASDTNLTLYLALPKGVYLFVVGFPVLNSKALVQLVCTSGTIAQQVSNGVYGYTMADSQTSWAGIFEVTSNNAEFRVRSAQSTAFTMSYIERGFIRAVQLAQSST